MVLAARREWPISDFIDLLRIETWFLRELIEATLPNIDSQRLLLHELIGILEIFLCAFHFLLDRNELG